MQTAVVPSEKKYEIKSYEANANGEIKPSFLLHHLEDIAHINADLLGFGYSNTYERGFGWFVLKYHLKFDRMPKNWETITVKSWPTLQKGIQCRRDFAIYDEDGIQIGTAASLWVLIDLNSKRIVPAKKMLNYPDLEPNYSFETEFEKIPPVENADKEITFTSTYEDIDINQHVNNANYLTWVLKAIDYDYLTKHSVKEIEINYKHEISCNSEVLCKTQMLTETNQTLHTISAKETGDEAANIRITWESR